MRTVVLFLAYALVGCGAAFLCAGHWCLAIACLFSSHLFILTWAALGPPDVQETL